MSDGLELLALVCHACELVGLDAKEAAEELGVAASRGESMSLLFELTSSPDEVRHLTITADPKLGQVEAQARLLQAHRRPAWVYGALQINHEWPHGGIRFSMDMSNGDLVLSGALSSSELNPHDLAVLLGDVMLGIERLLALGSAAQGPQGSQDSTLSPGFVLRG